MIEKDGATVRDLVAVLDHRRERRLAPQHLKRDVGAHKGEEHLDGVLGVLLPHKPRHLEPQRVLALELLAHRRLQPSPHPLPGGALHGGVPCSLECLVELPDTVLEQLLVARPHVLDQDRLVHRPVKLGLRFAILAGSSVEPGPQPHELGIIPLRHLHPPHQDRLGVGHGIGHGVKIVIIITHTRQELDRLVVAFHDRLAQLVAQHPIPRHLDELELLRDDLASRLPVPIKPPTHPRVQVVDVPKITKPRAEEGLLDGEDVFWLGGEHFVRLEGCEPPVDLGRLLLVRRLMTHLPELLQKRLEHLVVGCGDRRPAHRVHEDDSGDVERAFCGREHDSVPTVPHAARRRAPQGVHLRHHPRHVLRRGMIRRVIVDSMPLRLPQRRPKARTLKQTARELAEPIAQKQRHNRQTRRIPTRHQPEDDILLVLSRERQKNHEHGEEHGEEGVKRAVGEDGVEEAPEGVEGAVLDEALLDRQEEPPVGDADRVHDEPRRPQHALALGHRPHIVEPRLNGSPGAPVIEGAGVLRDRLVDLVVVRHASLHVHQVEVDGGEGDEGQGGGPGEPDVEEDVVGGDVVPQKVQRDGNHEADRTELEPEAPPHGREAPGRPEEKALRATTPCPLRPLSSPRVW
mmetsp:Transcript_45304/g.110307  ORF Transcript_45304/g.110307 Transcript_45304/m.110307 type:complete len:630 (-) Transcript_45304:8-1897(-)